MPSVIAIVTLAIGIGFTTAMFSLQKHVLWRPLPYLDAERLVTLWHPTLGSDATTQAFTTWPRLRAETPLVGLAAYAYGSGSLPLPDGRVHALNSASYVSPTLFSVLGTPPALGRVFAAADYQAGAAGVVVLGYDLWEEGFGSDASVVGTEVFFDGRLHEIVGVMPEGYLLPVDYSWVGRSEIFAPLIANPAGAKPFDDRALMLVGRLRDGEPSLRTFTRLEEFAPELLAALSAGGDEMWVLAAWMPVYGRVRPVIIGLVAAAFLVLLIVCANVASLQLARGDARRHEIGLRSALGARRRRLLRQLLTEGLVLSVAGGALALLITQETLRALTAAWAERVPRLVGVAIDFEVFGFCLAICALTTPLFALAPAWSATRGDVLASLRSGATATRHERWRRDLLVAVQVALCLVLVVLELLVVRGLMEATRIDLGFDYERLVTGDLLLPADRYGDVSALVAFQEDAVARLASVPGVESAAFSTAVPIWNPSTLTAVATLQVDDPARTVEGVGWELVTPDLLSTLGAQIVAGRGLSHADSADAPPVVVVNQALARQVWGDESALGLKVRLAEGVWREVVGVTADVRDRGLRNDATAMLFLPIRQTPPRRQEALRATSLIVRGEQPDALVGPILETIGSIDAEVAVANARPMTALIGDTLMRWHFSSALIGLFAVVALVLAAVGLYGVQSFSVSRRRHEIGIRLALGADPAGVMTMVTSQGIRVASAGLAVGLCLAALLVYWQQELLEKYYLASPGDVQTFVLATVVLLATAFVASWVPALRASKVDPAEVLREE